MKILNFIYAGLLLVLPACQTSRPKVVEAARPAPRLVIFSNPSDQTAALGATVTFVVVADLVPPWAATVMPRYQWQVNKTQYVPADKNLHWSNIPGATSPALMIQNLKLSDVGFYRVRVQAGALAETSEPAALQVQSPGSIILTGIPTVSSGSSGTACPGTYVGYVGYRGAWTFTTATDPNASPADSKLDIRCSSGSIHCDGKTVTMPSPSLCRPTVYFPTVVPSGPYSIILR